MRGGHRHAAPCVCILCLAAGQPRRLPQLARYAAALRVSPARCRRCLVLVEGRGMDCRSIDRDAKTVRVRVPMRSVMACMLNLEHEAGRLGASSASGGPASGCARGCSIPWLHAGLRASPLRHPARPGTWLRPPVADAALRHGHGTRGAPERHGGAATPRRRTRPAAERALVVDAGREHLAAGRERRAVHAARGQLHHLRPAAPQRMSRVTPRGHQGRAAPAGASGVESTTGARAAGGKARAQAAQDKQPRHKQPRDEQPAGRAAQRAWPAPSGSGEGVGRSASVTSSPLPNWPQSPSPSTNTSPGSCRGAGRVRSSRSGGLPLAGARWGSWRRGPVPL